jgi:hypothetical protein
MYETSFEYIDMFIPVVDTGAIVDHSARGLQITATYRIADFRGRWFTVMIERVIEGFGEVGVLLRTRFGIGRWETFCDDYDPNMSTADYAERVKNGQ